MKEQIISVGVGIATGVATDVVTYLQAVQKAEELNQPKPKYSWYRFWERVLAGFVAGVVGAGVVSI